MSDSLPKPRPAGRPIYLSAENHVASTGFASFCRSLRKHALNDLYITQPNNSGLYIGSDPHSARLVYKSGSFNLVQIKDRKKKTSFYCYPAGGKREAVKYFDGEEEVFKTHAHEYRVKDINSLLAEACVPKDGNNVIEDAIIDPRRAAVLTPKDAANLPEDMPFFSPDIIPVLTRDKEITFFMEGDDFLYASCYLLTKATIYAPKEVDR